jgi:hypothetical protein
VVVLVPSALLLEGERTTVVPGLVAVPPVAVAPRARPAQPALASVPAREESPALTAGPVLTAGPDAPHPEPKGSKEPDPMLEQAERVIALLTDPSLPSPPELDDRPELPRRSRQTHLSPKLRPEGDVNEPEQPQAEAVDPDTARSRMSALQRGTMRARVAEPEEPR